MMNEYTEMTREFLETTGTTVSIRFTGYKECSWDEPYFHNRYCVTLKRAGKKFSFTFWDSRHNTMNNLRPTEYDVLACLEKYDVGSFEDFCSEFGYKMYPDFPEDANKYGYNKETYKTYKAVKEQYEKVFDMFYDVMEQLTEIA